jgi:hypothetical protein
MLRRSGLCPEANLAVILFFFNWMAGWSGVGKSAMFMCQNMTVIQVVDQ